MGTEPDILLLIVDQMAWRALRCYGDTTVERAGARTPHIAGIAAAGVRFANAFTSYPLCQPARAAWWTGRHPHELGVTSNGGTVPVPRVGDTVACLGEIFAQGGYEAVHFGKTHDAGSLRGFRIVPMGELPVAEVAGWPVGVDTRNDRHTTSVAVEHLRSSAARAPRLTVVDLVNPHDICQWVGANRGVHDSSSALGELPPLPANFRDIPGLRQPPPVDHVCCAHNRQAQTVGWIERDFRCYLAAYDHYIERVDGEIGLLLAALASSGRAERTTLVFMSDHGDAMTAHGLVTKHTTFYEETTRIPFLVAGAGVAGGRVIRDALISQLDLLPTLCDLAGLPHPHGLWGRSLVPWITGRDAGTPHDHVATEWYSEWGYTTEPGRMIRTARYKYTRYREDRSDGVCEQFFDLSSDPGERQTLIGDPAYAPELARHRRVLSEHLAATRDDFFATPSRVDPRWRAHARGRHTGPAAPEAAALARTGRDG